jgi:hypothetical protein
VERAIRRALGVTTLAACAAVAGCAAAGTTARGTAPARGTAAAPAVASRPAPAATPRQRAVADAAAILNKFVPPPGARRLAKAPGTDGGLLKFPSSSVVSIALVDDASFWLAPGQPPAVLAWEQAHLPRQFTPEDQGFGPPSWDRMFSLPPVPGVLTDRELAVEVIAASGGQTAIRVDAQVAWQPPRPRGEYVPSAARVVTVAAVPDIAAPAGAAGRLRLPAPVTITSAPAVARLAALVDSLPLSTIGVASCPAFLAPVVQLTFRARPGGPALAVAQGPAPCGIVLFTLGGRQQPALQVPDGFVSRVLATAGLRWRLF